MNARKAKKLRREARRQSVGQPERVMVQDPHVMSTVRLMPTCTRGLAQDLKRLYKRGLVR